MNEGPSPRSISRSTTILIPAPNQTISRSSFASRVLVGALLGLRLPDNSMVSARPAGSLVWRDTSLGWPDGSRLNR